MAPQLTSQRLFLLSLSLFLLGNPASGGIQLDNDGGYSFHLGIDSGAPQPDNIQEFLQNAAVSPSLKSELEFKF
jgi:hypothetical protein